MEVANYTVRDVERTTSGTGASGWKVTFLRLGSELEKIELTVSAAVFAVLDLDASYTTKDLMHLRTLNDTRRET